MKSRFCFLSLLGLASLLLTGCFTLKSFGLSGDTTPRVYGGTRVLLEVVEQTPDEAEYFVDLPFSMAADTLLLPVTGVWALVD